MFNPKNYLEGKITSENCNHELLSTFGMNEGMYGSDYECLICGEPMHFNSQENPNLDEKFIFYSYGFLSKEEIPLLKLLLDYICRRYSEESSIDIKTIFDKIYPSIENIGEVLQEISLKSDVERKRVLEKYENLLNNEADDASSEGK